MVKRPLVRYAVLYAVLELTAFALLIWAFGVAWTLVLAAAVFMLGVLLAASQVKGQFAAARRRSSAHGAVADGALVGVGSFLVFLPGIVTTAAGALMLAPPTRTAMRPIAAAMVSRGVMRGMRAVDLDQFIGGRPLRRDYIDGEVLDEVGIDRLPVRR